MQRSKTQVMFNHLPGQVFRHENGVIAQVKRVATEPSYAINQALVFDGLSRELGRWTYQNGYRDPSTHPDRYSLVEPVDEVVYDLWPLNMRCKRCGVIRIFNSSKEIPGSPRCRRKGCGGHLEQLPFLQVHQCGNLQPLLIQRCNTHGYDALVLDDPGNFADAQLRCLDCGVPVKGLGYRGCTGCNIFSRALVVENFPIALVAYGWTRLTNKDTDARLNAFPPLRNDKTPLYVSTSNTEAVFLELDPVRVCLWLHENGLLAAAPANPREARLQVLREMAAETPAAAAARNLCHTISHALIRNLGELAGFGEDTMAEYLIPEALTIGLYANVHQEFTLGALVSLVEHNLSTWLKEAMRGTEICTWDPRCSEHDGACANCLHLAFGCEHRNHSLDRALLYGFPNPDARWTAVATGYWT